MIRKARIKDAKCIHKIVNHFASKNLMMPRSLNEIYETIRDFWIFAKKPNKIMGCVALHVVGWDNLAEIKSLAVEPRHQHQGIGSSLIEACLKEARELHVAQVFALSYNPRFFKKFGFKIASKARLPHKVWAECCNCPKFPDCGEIALIKKVE
ncbi:MAG: N-acetyltransferase [Candidatus Omnitrophota bacterium]